MAKKYWLMKTEPDAFSFDDLIAAPDRTEGWDGVRNYQARNLMRDEFSEGDEVLIYHSRIDEPCVVGLARVASGPKPDPTALDKRSKYFDPKSEAAGESRWVLVDVQATARFSNHVTLAQMRDNPRLEGLPLLRRGQRLSIQPVEAKHWKIINKLGLPKPL